MQGLKQSRAFTIEENALASIRKEFCAGRAGEKEVAAVIREVCETSGLIMDPHSAVGLHVARRFHSPSSPMVTLATAHAAKFPAAVKSACGIDPALPSWLSDLMNREEHFDILPSDLDTVETYIERHARAAG